jgi:hypothetical protein
VQKNAADPRRLGTPPRSRAKTVDPPILGHRRMAIWPNIGGILALLGKNDNAISSFKAQSF